MEIQARTVLFRRCMAYATGLVNTQDAFLERQLQQQQALHLQLLQQSNDLGTFTGQHLSPGSLHGFNTQAPGAALYPSMAGVHEGQSFDGSASANGALTTSSLLFNGSNMAAMGSQGGSAVPSTIVHGRHSADPTMAFSHQRAPSLGGFGAIARAASHDLGHIGEELNMGEPTLDATVTNPSAPHSNAMQSPLRNASDPQDSQMTSAPGLDGCKLVILGLPWDTEEQTLETYFAQYGPLEEAVIMKDRYTGKSRGFGFVSFKYAADASRVMASEHQIDGRRCEAKLALPRGGASPSRTTRIFVARILPGVTDEAFKAHFEQYGTVQDAYMPKDASKLGHRGIGFVTFASPDSVEAVISAAPHVLHGQELAIDQATPKDRGAASNLTNSLALSNGSQGNLLYGSGGGNMYGGAPGLSMNPAALAAAAGSAALRAGDAQQQLAMLAARGPSMDPASLAAFVSMNAANGAASMQGLPGMMAPPMHEMGMGPQNAHYPVVPHPGGPPPLHGNGRQPGADMSARVRQPGQPGAGGAPGPGGLDAHAGPRIFVGKLNRATTEADVREYFTRFGFVLDVYMPRDKHNRHEHRGFGFVTFETEAAVQRVGAHGIHHIRGVAVAIDSAVPRKEEAPGQLVVAPPAGGGYPNPGVPSGEAPYPGLAAAMHVIDLAARGDAGPLRHVHAAATAQGRYRPYGPQGGDMGPGPGGY